MKCRGHDWWSMGSTIYCECMNNGWGEEFVTAKRRSEFHDDQLAELTDRLNALIAPAKAAGDKTGKSLGLLMTERGVFLAWTEHVAHDATAQSKLPRLTIEEKISHGSSHARTDEEKNRALVALGIESEEGLTTGAKRELTPEELANLKVLQSIRPAIVDVVNAVLASHGLSVVVARVDFADATSRLAGETQRQCVMCCCAAGYYSCCTAC